MAVSEEPDIDGGLGASSQLRWRFVLLAGLVLALALILVLRNSRRAADFTLTRGEGPTTVGNIASEPAAAALSLPVENHVLIASGGRALSPDEIEVCGFGVVNKTQSEQPAFGEALARRWNESSRLLTARLLAGETEQQRSLGLYLLAMEQAEPVRQQAARDQAACAEEKSCVRAVASDAARLVEAVVRPGLDRLVDTALASRDPAVYAIALHACRGDSPGRCALLSARQWAALDPDNAVPWLYVADDATTHKDDATRLDALYHASVATRNERYDQLLGIADPALKSLGDETTQLSTFVTIIGLQAAWSFPPLQVVTKACSSQELADSNRRQLCDGLATMLLRQTRSPIEGSIGERLAERLGWPEERMQAQRQEALAVYGFKPVQPAEAELFSCAGLRVAYDRALATSRFGEVEATRLAIVASGQSIPELAAKVRELRHKADAEYARRPAASAPSLAASS